VGATATRYVSFLPGFEPFARDPESALGSEATDAYRSSAANKIRCPGASKVPTGALWVLINECGSEGPERYVQHLQICKFANSANASPSSRTDQDMNTEKAAQRQPRGSMGGMSHVAICIAESCTARDLFAKIANLQMLQIDLQATELTWVRIRRRPLGDSRVAPWVGCHMVPCIAESCTARDSFATFAKL
jgi:hypothetical protein